MSVRLTEMVPVVWENDVFLSFDILAQIHQVFHMKYMLNYQLDKDDLGVGKQIHNYSILAWSVFLPLDLVVHL